MCREKQAHKPIIFLFLIMVVFIFTPRICHAIPIFVKIKGVEKGDITYFNVSKIDYNKGYLVLSGTWENDGSVGCRVWMKVDVFNNNSDLIFVSWSYPKSVAPGGVYNIENIWYFGNKSGVFILKPTFYYCDKMKELKSIVVHLKPHNSTKPKEINDTSFVYNDKPNLIVVKLNNTVPQGVYEIIPTYNPLGFRFYPVKIEINKTCKEFAIPYYYNFLREVKIRAVMVGLNRTNRNKLFLITLSTKIVRKHKKKPIFSLQFYSYLSLFEYFLILYLPAFFIIWFAVKFFKKKEKKNE